MTAMPMDIIKTWCCEMFYNVNSEIEVIDYSKEQQAAPDEQQSIDYSKAEPSEALSEAREVEEVPEGRQDSQQSECRYHSDEEQPADLCHGTQQEGKALDISVNSRTCCCGWCTEECMAGCVEDFEEISLDGDEDCLEECCVWSCGILCYACCLSCWAIPFGNCSQKVWATSFLLPPIVIIVYFLIRALLQYDSFKDDFWPWMNVILLSCGWILTTYLWAVNIYLCCVLIWSFQGLRHGQTENSAPMCDRLCLGGIVIGLGLGIGLGIVPRIRTDDAEDFFFVKEFELLRVVSKVGLGCFSGLIILLASYMIAAGFFQGKVGPCRTPREEDLSSGGQKVEATHDHHRRAHVLKMNNGLRFT